MSPESVEILESLRKQVERLQLSRQPMSPVEAALVNALTCLVSVLIHENRGT